MKNKLLHIGVDEITFTIRLKEKVKMDEWDKRALNIIFDFVSASMVDIIFNGDIEPMTTGSLNGYTRCYNMGPKDFYFAMAYNEMYPNMGVCVRFSAKAWAVYRYRYEKLYQKKIILPDFLKMVADGSVGEVRLSRIDMTADYFNYDINLSELYDGLRDDAIIVQDDRGRKRIKNIRFVGSNACVQTIYVGSQKENTKGFLRIYDKKNEQIQTNGYRKQEALDCKNWIRFEAVFRGKYAHIISETLLDNEWTGEEFEQYIAQMITQKYRFVAMDTEQYEDFTQKLLDVADGSDKPDLYCGSPRDNSLRQNIAHIKHGSGLYPTLYKIGQLFGKGAEDEFMNYIFHCYKTEKWMSRQMYRELTLWLKKHEDLKNGQLKDNY